MNITDTRKHNALQSLTEEHKETHMLCNLQLNMTDTRKDDAHNHGLLVGCLMSQQRACVSQGWICSDNFTCWHTEIEVADQSFYLTQSKYTDTGPTSPGPDPLSPAAWHGSHWSANFQVTGMTEKSPQKRDSNPASSALQADALTTRPARRLLSRLPTVCCKACRVRQVKVTLHC